MAERDPGQHPEEYIPTKRDLDIQIGILETRIIFTQRMLNNTSRFHLLKRRKLRKIIREDNRKIKPLHETEKTGQDLNTLANDLTKSL